MLAAQIQNLPPIPTPPAPPAPAAINTGPQEHVPYEDAYEYTDAGGARKIGTLDEVIEEGPKQASVTMAVAQVVVTMETAVVSTDITTAKVYAGVTTAVVSAEMDDSDE